MHVVFVCFHSDYFVATSIGYIKNLLLAMMEEANSEDELNVLLKSEYKALGIDLPYSGDFDAFMNDASSVLEFK